VNAFLPGGGFESNVKSAEATNDQTRVPSETSINVSRGEHREPQVERRFVHEPLQEGH